MRWFMVLPGGVLRAGKYFSHPGAAAFPNHFVNIIHFYT